MHSFNHSLIHSFDQWFINSFIRPSMHSFMHPVIRSFGQIRSTPFARSNSLTIHLCHLLRIGPGARGAQFAFNTIGHIASSSMMMVKSRDSNSNVARSRWDAVECRPRVVECHPRVAECRPRSLKVVHGSLYVGQTFKPTQPFKIIHALKAIPSNPFIDPYSRIISFI